MRDSNGGRRYRFGAFEVDTAAGELRQRGLRVRLHRQPFEVLCLLLERPGEVLSREEISRALWPEGTFVDFDHGVNAAVNRLREALRDKASAPRFIETLPRRGYRFVAPVERVGTDASEANLNAALPDPSAASPPKDEGDAELSPAGNRRPRFQSGWLASPEDLPELPARTVRLLFVALQGMYLAFYFAALANAAEVRELLEAVPLSGVLFWATLGSAGALIPLRMALFTASLLGPPRGRARFLRFWPFLLLMDLFWALSPFLLLHHISFGLALACVAPLVYAPFAQRSLVLMGALAAGRPE